MIRNECAKVYSACTICATSGRPADRKKISTTHVNAAFNDEIQEDSQYVYIRGMRHEILSMIDTAKGKSRRPDPRKKLKGRLRLTDTTDTGHLIVSARTTRFADQSLV